jgi:hypothetical protein
MTQHRPTPSRTRRVRVLRGGTLHACLGIPRPATADRHWRAPPRGESAVEGDAHVASPRRTSGSLASTIAETAFARSGGASRGLARAAALATGLKWPIMAFALSTIP